jgi:hypothetical protein
MSAQASTRGMVNQRPVRERGPGMRTSRPRFLSQHDVGTSVIGAVEVTNDEQRNEQAEAPESGVHAVDDVGRARDGSAMDLSLMGLSGLGEQVTLVVYGWKNVEPGTLSWVFPSLTAALAAARTMTNASCWSIVAGTRESEVDIDAERSHGAVLVEQAS